MVSSVLTLCSCATISHCAANRQIFFLGLIPCMPSCCKTQPIGAAITDGLVVAEETNSARFKSLINQDAQIESHLSAQGWICAGLPIRAVALSTCGSEGRTGTASQQLLDFSGGMNHTAHLSCCQRSDLAPTTDSPQHTQAMAPTSAPTLLWGGRFTGTINCTRRLKVQDVQGILTDGGGAMGQGRSTT